MNLQAHYDQLFQTSLEKIKRSNFDIDENLDTNDDDRYGITLLIRPPAPITNSIQAFLSELQRLEPDQYYYPNSDLHITVMSIISCYSGFELQQIQLSDYLPLIQASLASHGPFEIQCKGITASTSCVMIQGFMQDSTLNEIRANLRLHFQQSKLEQSLDQRYTIQTAHSTVIRFRKPVQQKKGFLAILEKYRTVNFGSFQVGKMELVANDWYQKATKVKSLHQFLLK